MEINHWRGQFHQQEVTSLVDEVAEGAWVTEKALMHYFNQNDHYLYKEEIMAILTRIAGQPVN